MISGGSPRLASRLEAESRSRAHTYGAWMRSSSRDTDTPRVSKGPTCKWILFFPSVRRASSSAAAAADLQLSSSRTGTTTPRSRRRPPRPPRPMQRPPPAATAAGTACAERGGGRPVSTYNNSQSAHPLPDLSAGRRSRPPSVLPGRRCCLHRLAGCQCCRAPGWRSGPLRGTPSAPSRRRHWQVQHRYVGAARCLALHC